MPRAVQRNAARRDFIIHYAYLLEHAGLTTAQSFREAVEQTYTELAEMPDMGAAGKVPHGKRAGVRLWSWRVRDFEDYIVAYRHHRVGCCDRAARRRKARLSTRSEVTLRDRV
jgi:plasmid stabilization system protein ParE